MPAQGPITGSERWTITLEIDGERGQQESQSLREDLDRLVAKYNKSNKKASWRGRTVVKT